MTKLSIVVLLAFASAFSLWQPGAAGVVQDTVITVSAGDLARRDTIVSFALPANLKARSYALRDEAGRQIALQVDSERQAWFVLQELKAGTSARFRLVTSTPARDPDGDVRLNKVGDHLAISVANRPVLAYQGRPGALPRADIKEIFRRGGYIHPVYTPSGRIVTDDYPPDHPHHHGIWFAWTKTEFAGRHPDFWNVGDGTGRVDFVDVDETWSGPVQAGFKSRHRYVDVSAKPPAAALNETWKVLVYRSGQGDKKYAMFDLIATHECATSIPLVLPEYRYGGVGFRGHRDWLPKDNCVFLTSEGKTREDGHATRARWCHIGGKIDGQLAGIAILDHPANFRAPQPMRINPDQPFFCYAPPLAGQFEIKPGQQYVSRYRFIVYDGPPDRDRLDRLWNEYANPPQVTIGR